MTTATTHDVRDAVVLTKAQRLALTRWVLGTCADESCADEAALGKQVTIYNDIRITVADPEYPVWQERYGPGHAFNSVTYGPGLLIERGVPAEVFEVEG